jgi:TPP-dependent pyruvate/acetoin dehydrogenase alpha subunit
LATEDELRQLAAEVDVDVDAAARFAEESPAPDPRELCAGVLVTE